MFNGNESLKSNLGFMNGIAGKSGYSIETINGIEMFVAYSPMHALSTDWIVLSSNLMIKYSYLQTPSDWKESL